MRDLRSLPDHNSSPGRRQFERHASLCDAALTRSEGMADFACSAESPAAVWSDAWPRSSSRDWWMRPDNRSVRWVRTSTRLTGGAAARSVEQANHPRGAVHLDELTVLDPRRRPGDGHDGRNAQFAPDNRGV
jgi:hypothetical protein